MIFRWKQDPTIARCALRSYRSGNSYLLAEVSHIIRIFLLELLLIVLCLT